MEVKHEVEYEDGELILMEGGESDRNIYVLLEGQARVTKETDKGQVSLALLEEGDIFGEVSFLAQKAQSPVISDGEADILMSFEPLETLRALRKCSSSSLVISNNSPISPFNVASGREQYPDVGEMMLTVSNHVNRLIALDARSLAREAGSELSVNMVMIGALMRHAEMPFGREVVETVLNTKTKKAFLKMNLKAFDLGFQAK